MSFGRSPDAATWAFPPAAAARSCWLPRGPILAGLVEEMAITPFKPCRPRAAYVPRVVAAAYYRETGTSKTYTSKTYDPNANTARRCLEQLREAAESSNINLRIPRRFPLFAAEAHQWAAPGPEGKARYGLVVMRLDFTARPMMIETILLGLDLPMLFFVPNQRMFGVGTYQVFTNGTRAPGH